MPSMTPRLLSPLLPPLLHFTLYSRSYCHLCDDMLTALRAFENTLGGTHDFVIDVVDVDSDPALQTLYDELVPVLFAHAEHRPAERLCHYFLDEEALKRFMASLA